jgi:hypothetical protein
MARTTAPRALPRDRTTAEMADAGAQSVSRPVFLTVKEAAALLRLSEITLARWRIEGYGPPFRKFGRRVVYGNDDLLTWAERQSRSSTSCKGKAWS